MSRLARLFENNRRWAAETDAKSPGFFTRLASLQAPHLMWIGCADSRVPANEIAGLLPGEVFVHRNVSNIVEQTDFNLLSAVQYAVDVLKVEDLIVCGHYGCGGVEAAHADRRLGLIDNWLRHIQSVRDMHAGALAALPESARLNRLCELNVIEQAVNLCRTTVVSDAWRRSQPLAVHAWIYGLDDGLLHDLGFVAESEAGIGAARAAALSRLGGAKR